VRISRARQGRSRRQALKESAQLVGSDAGVLENRPEGSGFEIISSVERNNDSTVTLP